MYTSFQALYSGRSNGTLGNTQVGSNLASLFKCVSECEGYFVDRIVPVMSMTMGRRASVSGTFGSGLDSKTSGSTSVHFRPVIPPPFDCSHRLTFEFGAPYLTSWLISYPATSSLARGFLSIQNLTQVKILV